MELDTSGNQQGFIDLLIARVPEDQRTDALIEAVDSLTSNDIATTALVCRLLETHHDSRPSQLLLRFLNTEARNGASLFIAKVCSGSPWAATSILDSLLRSLRDFQYVSLDNSFFLPGITRAQLRLDQELSAPVEPQQDVGDSATEAVNLLRCVRDLFRSALDHPLSLRSGVPFTSFFGCIFSCDAYILTAAKEAIFALVTYFGRAHVSSDDIVQELFDESWKHIDLLLQHGTANIHQLAAHHWRLRMLLFAEATPSVRMPVLEDAYWRSLQEILSTGSTEMRKVALQTLRQSLRLLESGRATLQSSTYIGKTQTSDYERFCTVYETIILGRYMNQIQACIVDLDYLASPKSVMQTSWLIVLVRSALTGTMQDSIQREVGLWFMRTKLSFSSQDRLETLLGGPFLTWAADGRHFTTSLHGTLLRKRCVHGDRLSSFVTRLLAELSHDQSLSNRCMEAMLQYLSASKNRILPAAVNYTIKGLHDAVQVGSTQIKQRQKDLLSEISSVVGFPEVARDVLQALCSSMLDKPQRLSEESDSIENLPSRTAGPDTSVRWTTIGTLVAEIRDSRHSVLRGTGLIAACQSVERVLSSETEELNTSDVTFAIEATWAEAEIQDFPKAVLMRMPAVVMHSTVMRLAQEDQELSKVQYDIISQYRQLARYRIYVWAPFMTSLRDAIFSFPTSIARLDVLDLLVEVANSPYTARLEVQLEAAHANMLLTLDSAYQHLGYEHYFGATDGLGYAAYYDLINRLSSIDERTADTLLQRLMDPWLSQTLPVPQVSRWKTTEQLQVILIIVAQRASSWSQETVRSHLESFLQLLRLEPVPRFRYLIEWATISIVTAHSELSSDIISALWSKDHHSSPKYMASLTKIATLLARLDGANEEFGLEVASVLVALSASSKIIIRHEAQWSFPVLWDHAESKHWTSITANKAFKALVEYIWSLDRFKDPPELRSLDRLDPGSQGSLMHLLSGAYLRLEPPGMQLVTHQDFLKLWQIDNEKGHETLPARCISLGEDHVDNLTEETHTQERSQKAPEWQASTALQTKGASYLTDLDPGASEVLRPTQLIVVASLLDNSYNLGGISRVSEVFGAQSLHMDNPAMTLPNKDFQSVSVSSHQHLPIHGLPLRELTPFLTSMKMEGYCVVGVEQTDRSLVLGADTTVLPEKTVLVMGAEKEGIPASLLNECDMLVEIPQKGVIRSLNVQTAAAVVMFEYARQHRRQ